jgi:predicted MFS family arabinose efflux permease
MPRGSRDQGSARGGDDRLVVVLTAVTMVTGIISSLGAPLIPSVARTLHISLDSAQWSLTIALLSGAIAAPIMGRLGDGPRRRETIVGGLLIVFTGSIIAGLAHSLIVLVAGRALQGVGLGLAPVTMAAARDHLPESRSPTVIAILSVCGAAAVGAGYPISGLIDSDIGLHAAFIFGAVISGSALVAAARVIPSNRHAAPGSIDLVGALMITVGLIALLLTISEGQQWGWDSLPIVTLAAIALLTLAAWARLQLRRRSPLVDLRQLGHRAVLTADLAAIVLGIAMYMFLTLVTEFMQEPRSGGYGFGSSSLLAGLSLVPFSVMSLLASRSIGRISRYVSSSAILVGGSLLIAASGAFFALAHGHEWQAFVAMGGVGAGFGYTFAAIPGMITRAVPRRETGSAMGLYQVIRYVGFSLGSAIAASILAGYTINHGHTVQQAGYVNALWVGTAICGLSAVASALLTARDRPADPGARDATFLQNLAVEDAELASAGLVGIEGEGVSEQREVNGA